MSRATPGMVQAGVTLSQTAPKEASGASGTGILRLAESLHDEFSAPIGVFDPERHTWRAAVGAGESHFPRVDAGLLEVAGSARLRSGRVAIWRQPGRQSVLWLVLPLRSEALDLVAFAGFRRPVESDEGWDSGEDEA